MGLAAVHRLPGGATLTIETTRALAAVDVDLGADGPVSPRKAMEANLRAVRHAARLLRLKAIGGTAVIDLVGFPRHAAPVQEAAREAFEPDQPGVIVLPVSRLGLLQVGRPHRERAPRRAAAGRRWRAHRPHPGSAAGARAGAGGSGQSPGASGGRLRARGGRPAASLWSPSSGRVSW